MSHDPLCPWTPDDPSAGLRVAPAACECELIARVRLDEGQQFVSVLLDNAIVDLDALMVALQERKESRKGTSI